MNVSANFTLWEINAKLFSFRELASKCAAQSNFPLDCGLNWLISFLKPFSPLSPAQVTPLGAGDSYEMHMPDAHTRTEEGDECGSILQEVEVGRESGVQESAREGMVTPGLRID